MKKHKLFSIIGIAVSFVGLVLSFLLIREYFGESSTLCSAFGDGEGCHKVAQSDFSAIRKVPVFGDIPVALFGFMYYGVIATIFFFSFNTEDEEEAKKYFSTAFTLGLLGETIDVGLLVISVTMVHAICPLCVATYIVTGSIIALSIVGIFMNKNSNFNFLGIFQAGIGESLKAKLFTYSVVAIVLFGCGLGLGRSNSNPTSIGNQSDESVIKAKIAIYDQAPIIKIDLTNVPFVGSPSAPITIVKYADFNCGHCLHASHILKQALAEYSGMIKIYYKNFPLDGNCNRLVQRKSPDSSSCIGATGALCANKQGKFYQVYSAIYDDTERNVRQTVPNILSIAKANNLNIAAFQSCLNSSEIANHIAKEVDEAEILKVQSTPTIFVNNKAIEAGTPDPAYLSALLKHISSKL